MESAIPRTKRKVAVSAFEPAFASIVVGVVVISSSLLADVIFVYANA
jgi:hypothetical protein